MNIDRFYTSNEDELAEMMKAMETEKPASELVNVIMIMGQGYRRTLENMDPDDERRPFIAERLKIMRNIYKRFA